MTEETVQTTQSEQPVQNPEEIRWIEPGQVRWQIDNNRLQMRENNEAEWIDVGIYRLFPLSEPEAWLSVVNKENKEVGIIRNLHHCPHDALALIRQELSRRYLVPHILRIISCRDQFDITFFEVETDRGRITFQLRRQQENVQRPLPHRLTLIDIEGNRYDISDINNLDAESRRFLDERL
jgi:hypothetical protein